ncbi:YdcF family protein [Pedobacter arcticus]|uniref:YdcF family protein n=1 Tax=Pedobacter arcticus TaxID=752140 RepID=UPI0002F7FF05|nr:YdcF family protein [Pedobacter arcticus]
MSKFVLTLSIHLFLGLAGYSQLKPKNVMLILGSDQKPILTNRVKVALKLYHAQHIDKIIVSGGCAAHASAICEASEMQQQLTDGGVPKKIIYKEENSKTTAQNYVYSRVLKDEFGEKIIQKNDSLIVVSDHWHAISVAARFNQYDGVKAKFFIEGDLTPKPADLLDYVGIYNKVRDNNEFILRSTWPTPDAVYNIKGSTNYIFANRVYTVTTGKPESAKIDSLSKLFPRLTVNGDQSIDAIARDSKNGCLLIFNNLNCQTQFDNLKKKSINTPLNKLVSNLPADVKWIDAAFIKENRLYLFTKNKLIIASRSGSGFKVVNIDDVKNWISNWPYSWGKGDLTAADYDEQTKTIYLYKNRESLTINNQQKSENKPEKLVLKWQDFKN